MRSPLPLLFLLLALLELRCAQSAVPQPDGPIAGFVTLLGDDTLAVERFERTPISMKAEVVLRSPRTTYREYVYEHDGFGNLQRYEAIVRVPDAAPDTPPLRREVVLPQGDSLQLTVTERGLTETHVFAAERTALPFIDMVHWPFELAVRRAHASEEDSTTQQMFSGQGTMSFGLRRIGPGRIAVSHPFRGSMQVQVDTAGAIQRLDARGTTRKLMVHRLPAPDIEPYVHRYAGLDASGQSFGELSGRGETVAEIHGARVTVDYGRPAKRGREIFGSLVPYGEVWRTGANMATHLQTDRELTFGDVRVPAGRYTLFTIPGETGATLIINRQTGQSGTSYDPAQDLARVEMARDSISEPVEVFSVEIIETDAGGVLQLQWDRTAYLVPFMVE